MLKISGFNPNSYVDYPGNIASVVFVGGCNFDCWFCHNRWLLTAKETFNSEEILTKIKSKSGFIDGVVISGGEPTCEDTNELLSFIKSIKEYGLKVKLDTNGTHFDVLQKLLPYLDYVAMDIKAPLSKYRDITCITDEELINIKKSISLLKSLENCEFRTTALPTLNEDDFLEIIFTIRGAKKYFIQQFRPVDGMNHPAPHSGKFLKDLQKKANNYVQTEIRGV